jgi:glutaminase
VERFLNNGGGSAPASSTVASPIQTYLERLHATHATNTDGAVATYIPELAKADPEWFGISLVTSDGYLYEVGDSRQLFTIQSISKPFVYGLAMEDNGRDKVLAKIGVEPTGDAFNSISLAPGTGCPLNPMINAGAIAASSMVAGHSPEDAMQRLVTVLSTYAGRPLTIDHAVYVSERDTGHRNRAISHMLRNFDIIGTDPEPGLDLYFQQCSVAVDCRDLAVMAATLANDGVNPLTGERAVSGSLVDSILSIMTTCGMYDYAGQWVYTVGLPAKSGVAGGVLAVLPGQLGIGVFSPRLDARGNSVRGVSVCTAISRDLNLHFLSVPRSSRSVIRSRRTLAEVSSKRLRTEAERKRLDTVGQRVLVYELQGDLVFAALETTIRALVADSAHADIAILDCKRVSATPDCAVPMLQRLIADFAAFGKQLLIASVQPPSRLVRALEEVLATGEPEVHLHAFSDLDHAIEWSEDRLLGELSAVDAQAIDLAQHQVLHGISPDALAHLERIIQWKQFAPGESIIRRGDAADGMYLIMRGRVSVSVDLPNGQVKRLSTLSAGMAFGELGMIDHVVRNADVHADLLTECVLIPIDGYERLGQQHPTVMMHILENLLRQLSRTVSRLNQEVWALSS